MNIGAVFYAFKLLYFLVDLPLSFETFKLLTMMYDLVIIGGGPAGVAAGVYAARKKMKTLLIADSFGGQSLVAADIQNFIGIKSISGWQLAKQMEEHLRAFEGIIEIIDSDRVSKIEKGEGGGFSVFTENGKSFETKTVLMAVGSRRKKLDIPGEKRLEGKGVSYCSTCDAPIFEDKTVAVVGGGNAGLEAVTDLIPYAKEIYFMARSGEISGDQITFDKIKNSPKVKIMAMVQATEILGDETVSGIKYKELKSGEVKEMQLDGIFVEIGWMPNSSLVKDLVNLNERGEIIVNHQTQASSLEGIWAAGDVCDVLYKQNNISMGDAIKAVLNIYDYLKRK